jgi:hypothetical protein
MNDTHPASEPIEPKAPPPEPSAAETIDDLQDDAMQRISDDGRPPAKRTRAREWRWFIGGATLTAVALATWLIVAGVSGGIAFAGVLYGIGLLVLASPVCLIGFFRAREEREARVEAVEIRRASAVHR